MVTPLFFPLFLTPRGQVQSTDRQTFHYDPVRVISQALLQSQTRKGDFVKKNWGAVHEILMRLRFNPKYSCLCTLVTQPLGMLICNHAYS